MSMRATAASGGAHSGGAHSGGAHRIKKTMRGAGKPTRDNDDGKLYRTLGE